MHSVVTKYGEWFYRAILLCAVCIGLWLNSRYVPRDEFSSLKSDVSAIQTTIKVMVEQNRVNDRQDAIIMDHESRIRVLERQH